MRRYLGAASIVGLLLAALSAPPVALGATTQHVHCGSGADLQTAIDAASDGDTLVISGTCVGNFTLLKDLTLTGQGPRATLAGGPVSTDAVLTALEATIRRLTIRGGLGDGIFDPGARLTLDHVTVRDNASAGIALHFGTLTMVDSTVSHNGAEGIVASGSDQSDDIRRSTVSNNGGVGIYNFNVMTLTDSTVRDNGAVGIANVSTLSGRGDLTVVGSTIRGNAGGGIENRWMLSISHSKVIDNTTTGFGGGIWNRDEYPNHLNFSGVLTMTDSKVTGNTAGTDGGGIYNSGPPGLLTLMNVKIKNNTPNDCVGC
jgi:parallel beta helix pectate lyase-like protein